MQKTEIRKIYSKLRNELDLTSVEQNSLKITKLFFEKFDLKNINNIHIFIPIKHKNEVNTWNIIKYIWEKYPKIQIVVPRIFGNNNDMENVCISQNTIFKTNNWGIDEPISEITLNSNKVDLVLIPLLAVDKNGNRVGYGKGFYDKMLQNSKPDIIKIGLSFFDILESKIGDTNEFDIPIDYLINQNGIVVF